MDISNLFTARAALLRPGAKVLAFDGMSPREGVVAISI
jgi:hypothetical protein